MSQPDEVQTMSATLKIGQTLKGTLDSYTLTHNLYNSVYKATNQPGGHVVKSVNHFRLQNERNVLRRFQERSPHIRPLLDEIDPDTPSHALVLKWLDCDLLDVTRARPLGSSELRLVAKGVLETLQMLHADGFVHADIKPGNVLVNTDEAQAITEVQLADFGSTVSKDSKHAKDGDDIGTPLFRSPEAQLQMSWSTSTDIWSFGVMMIDAIYGKGFHIMKPDVPIDHEDYDFKLLMRYHQHFGPFPWTYSQIADDDTLRALSWTMHSTPAESIQPFYLVASSEVSKKDKAFLVRILKLDPRDRPTAQALLEDDWFGEPEDS